MRAGPSLISLIPVVCILSLQAASPPPTPLEVDDEVVALAATSSGRVPLALLARRSVALVERAGDGWAVAARADLTPFVSSGARVARRPIGTLEAIEGDDDVALRLRIDAPALGLADRLELRREGVGFTSVPVELVPGVVRTLTPAAPKDAFGRRLEWLPERGDAASFHLDAENRLVATQTTGELLDSGGPIGELLLVAPAEHGEARVLVSSPSLPGQPDRILEYRFREGRLVAARRSHEFAGRIAAAVRIETGRDLVAVAVVDRPGHSRLHLLAEDDLWEAP
jgi:hypothetical protein